MEKMLLVLYGEKSCGKTTTLMSLVKLLVGPIGASLVDKTFLDKRGKYKDARMIVKYNNIQMFIATGGDSWYVCRENTEFFQNSFHNMDIYCVSSSEVRILSSVEKKTINLEPTICISACRPSGDKYGAIKALHAYNEKHLMAYNKQKWIRKETQKIENSNKKAADIKVIIDDFLATFPI